MHSQQFNCQLIDAISNHENISTRSLVANIPLNHGGLASQYLEHAIKNTMNDERRKTQSVRLNPVK